MKLFHPGLEKTLEVKKIEKVRHDIPNQSGEMETRECVEFIVVGQTSEWKDWLFLDDFQEANKERIINGEFSDLDG